MVESFGQSPLELREFLEFIEEDLGNVRRTLDEIEENDVDADFIVHSKSETVEESVESKGVEAERIVKTLVFIAGEDPVAVLAPGDSRVSEEKLAEVTGGDVRMASPEEVKEATGYIIGGVSPFDLDITVYMEESLMEREKVNPAAGSRVVGAEIDPEDLKDMINAEAGDFTE